ncbi:16S rRNA (cytidine(1402)-2'-O)-methyltransferase [Aurantiacibacter spongiae]|uniref:Ribosomal RNA small subunit methyltransferase I n=1 Tax=Aurantiacibacter spongiae TaxID=2488860 RepID=A0A3N5CUK0_9SPHN|nr:16S rRNA (cytidine(1402)-2'-O)-methyltransferase [Aurantiacibacter spongiae]RPF70299.1 16S rRNA (cytidine(1402)-2'-O)-methyltransferase [Aurantiacibacter spongiae]
MTETEASEPASHLSAGLYIVATPIGNLGDITLRAKDILARCDGIACEDTRVTQKLIRHLGISKPLWRYDDHSAPNDRARLVASMQERAVALVSDAGMPLVSDPGYRLVRDARQAGIAVTVLPGANAPLTALALSGLPNDRFLFAGFLPNKDKARADVLEELASVRSTLIFFETAPRLLRSLKAIGDILPAREVAVARELTKLYEECPTGSPDQLIDHYSAHPPRGEIVLLVGPPPAVEASAADGDAMLRERLADEKPSRAAAQVAKATGLDRKALYARALELKNS